MERGDALPALAEVFREHGYGASLVSISAATGLGKGSLYHFFPGGKEEMATAVLTEIDGWFEAEVFAPLQTLPNSALAIAAMFDAVETYFRSGHAVCLVGVLALGDARHRFAAAVHGYFERWVCTLAIALTRSGYGRDDADALADEIVGGIQGSLVLARALEDPARFTRTLARLRSRVAAPPPG